MGSGYTALGSTRQLRTVFPNRDLESGAKLNLKLLRQQGKRGHNKYIGHYSWEAGISVSHDRYVSNSLSLRWFIRYDLFVCFGLFVVALYVTPGPSAATATGRRVAVPAHTQPTSGPLRSAPPDHVQGIHRGRDPESSRRATILRNPSRCRSSKSGQCRLPFLRSLVQ